MARVWGLIAAPRDDPWTREQASKVVAALSGGRVVSYGGGVGGSGGLELEWTVEGADRAAVEGIARDQLLAAGVLGGRSFSDLRVKMLP